MTRIPPTAPNMAMRVAGLVGLGMTAFFWIENAKPDKWEASASRLESNMRFQNKSTEWGVYSGKSTMDGWAHALRMIPLSGPFLAYKTAKVYVEGFVNDVLLPTLLPTVLGLSALGLGFSDAFRGMATQFSKVNIPWANMRKYTWQGITQLGGAISKGLIKPIGNQAAYAFKHASGGTIAALGLLAFGVYQFADVFTGDSQRDMFMDDIAPPQFDANGPGF